MKISAILDQIDLGSIALPEFQRGYVWNRDQVRKLMASLYRRHPVGSLLVWVTQTQSANTRGEGMLHPGSVELLLDGQQRITSLYGIVRGCPPKFFDGKTDTFTGLYFNLEDETFEFYGPVKMRDDPRWINVTELMDKGPGSIITKLITIDEFRPHIEQYITRLTDVAGIRDIDLHIEKVTGEDKTIDVVVDIFNRVNSGGTKLSKGDLALAKVCAGWPEARDEMKRRLDKWGNAGFDFRLEWLLRCVNTVLTGKALFASLEHVDMPTFADGLRKTEALIDSTLNMIASRLGFDHDRVLGSRYSFPILTRYMMLHGGTALDHKERDKLLYWYVHTFLWGRYAGSTESVLSQDLGLIEEPEGALDRLISQLRQLRGDLKLRPNDFEGWSRSTRFYPLLYMLTRVCHARDWGNGLELQNHLLGNMSALELHHIFPKALLYKYNYQQSKVNALANFTFLTKETNLAILDRAPAEYLPQLAVKHPGAIESHWIPMDPELWKPENYNYFLEARRELLAEAANEFLESLLIGTMPEGQVVSDITTRTTPVVIGGIDNGDEEQILNECSQWMKSNGLPGGDLSYELLAEDTNQVIAVLDLAWPNGLQEGYSQPVALIIDEDFELEERINAIGYRFFTKAEDLKTYVLREILADSTDME